MRNSRPTTALPTVSSLAATIICDLDEGSDPLTFSEAAKVGCLRRSGRGPHVSQIYRWSTKGVRGVRLESAYIGGTRVTTRPAILRFIERLSTECGSPATLSTDRQHRAAEAALDAANI